MKIRLSNVLAVATAAVAIAGAVATVVTVKKVLKDQADISVKAEDDSEVEQATEQHIRKVAMVAGAGAAATIVLGGLTYIVTKRTYSRAGIHLGELSGISAYFAFLTTGHTDNKTVQDVFQESVGRLGKTMTIDEYRIALLDDLGHIAEKVKEVR